MKIDPFKTIDLEPGCTLRECLKAVQVLSDYAPRPFPRKEQISMASMFLRISKEATAPFEVRIGGPDNVPLIVVHPAAGKEAGIRAKEQAIAEGDWNTHDVTRETFKSSRKTD